MPALFSARWKKDSNNMCWTDGWISFFEGNHEGRGVTLQSVTGVGQVDRKMCLDKGMGVAAAKCYVLYRIEKVIHSSVFFLSVIAHNDIYMIFAFCCASRYIKNYFYNKCSFLLCLCI